MKKLKQILTSDKALHTVNGITIGLMVATIMITIKNKQIKDKA